VRDELRSAPNLTLLPWLTDEELRDEYRRASLVLLPLMDCTANCALLEAIACATPVVVTDVGGVWHYVDRDCAVLCERNDAEHMVECTLGLLGDPGRRERLGAAARAHAWWFEWGAVVRRYAELYRTVAAAY
jgi:glycosyltransferase involved in cell wall biosynthesis